MKKLCILNTRPLSQKLFLDNQFDIIHIPALEIVAINTWVQKFIKLNSNDYMIFTSVNAVEYFFKELPNHNIVLPKNITIIAIGETTGKKLLTYNVIINAAPAIANSENLLKLEILHDIFAKKILLIKGIAGLNLITQKLTERGAEVINLDVYQRLIPKYDDVMIQKIWQQNIPDVILFTSQQSMQNILLMFGKEAKSWLFNKPCIVLSDRLAHSAYEMGFKKVIVSLLVNIVEVLKIM